MGTLASSVDDLAGRCAPGRRGDSIPYNSPDDCPGCTGFVDQYAKAVQKATGSM